MSDKMDVRQMQKDFLKRLDNMLDLIARGRGIEILIRIADQTHEGIAIVSKSYESMMKSGLRINNLHPPKALPRLFTKHSERKRIELARDIADKIAHGVFREARKLIDQYHKVYGLKTRLNSDGLMGWKVESRGHLVDEDGRHIESIVDIIKSSKDNLIVEEFDVFVHNNYDKAAREIFEDAWRRIGAGSRSLAVEVVKLHMFRGFKRGRRTYSKKGED